MFSNNYQRVIVAVAAIAVLGVTGVGYASPAINLETFADWDAALGAGAVRPMTPVEFGDLKADNPGTGSPFDWPGNYSEPELYVAEGGGYPLDSGETLDGPGLVMSWGEPTGGEFTAAWRFEYPLDPNIVGQTLTATICPPQFAASGAQMNSVGFGFTDAGMPGPQGWGPQVRTYTWNVAAAANAATNTIAWNQNWNVTIGPVLGMMPPAPPPDPATAVDQATGATVVAPIFFSSGAGGPFGPPGPPFFNPGTVMFLDAYENGMGAGSMALPPGGLTNLPLWNWWGNVVVTPEPGTISLLALGALAILRRKRR